MKKQKVYEDPAANLDEIMREDAEMADKARQKAYDAQTMAWIAIGLSVLSIVLAVLRLLMR